MQLLQGCPKWSGAYSTISVGNWLKVLQHYDFLSLTGFKNCSACMRARLHPTPSKLHPNSVSETVTQKDQKGATAEQKMKGLLACPKKSWFRQFQHVSGAMQLWLSTNAPSALIWTSPPRFGSHYMGCIELMSCGFWPCLVQKPCSLSSSKSPFPWSLWTCYTHR